MTDALALRDNAKKQLQQIKTIEEGKKYLSQMTALEHWLKAEKKDSELQFLVTQQKIRTQRIIGNFIQVGQAKGEIAVASDNLKGRTEINANNFDKKKNLSDLGITPFQSSTFQKIASIPTETFEEAIARHKDDVNGLDFELTTTAIVKLADKLNGKPSLKIDPRDSFNRHKLIELIERKKVSQYTVALETGVEVSTLSRVITGEIVSPSFDFVARMGEYFNEPMESFKKGLLL